MRLRLLVPLVLLFAGPPLACAAEADVLAKLRPGHPRLLVLDDGIARVKQLATTDATAKNYFEQMRSAGNVLLTAAPAERVIRGPRLLQVSRQVLDRVLTLGGLYRLSGERKYADRCRDELLAVAKFSDWNPSHFLDVAEMTNAFGIGYDWIFDTLTKEQRQIIRTAIVEKGLKPGLKVYESKSGWPQRTNNWSQVCNGGLSVGALAIADEEPKLAGQILEHARRSLPVAMAAFSDGGCIEGPGYWNYATLYIAFYAAAMQTALNDRWILDSAGLKETGLFRIQTAGPVNLAFNFGDGGEGVGPAAQMFYFARAFSMPTYAAHERLSVARNEKIDPLHLLWFNPDGAVEDIAKLPRSAKFDRIDVALFRSAWNDRDAAFVGFKGGYNAASHCNLDLGTFIYDADGIRWATELGPDDYNLPGYFGSMRWTYYRTRTEGQNTLTIDGENQNLTGRSKIVEHSADEQFAVADLTEAYADQVKHATRRVSLSGKQLTIEDQLQADRPVEVIWHMHTRAKIETNGDRATLSEGEKHLEARILSPPGAKFEIVPADPPPAEKANPPMRLNIPRLKQKLIVRLPQKVTELQLKVVLTPSHP
jgi:hypothetical protein